MIVSNTTPLSSLLKIGKAHLLQTLYGTLTIPPEVAAELDQAGSIHEGWRTQLGFVRAADSSEHDPVKALLVSELDPGEAAAIALAHRIDSKLLIVEDMAGRRIARRLGLTVIGTVGVILTAGESRLIDEPYAVLEELRTRGGLWLTRSSRICALLGSAALSRQGLESGGGHKKWCQKSRVLRSRNA